MKKRVLIPFVAFALTTAAVGAYAALPSSSIDPSTIPLGSLAAKTSVTVQSVDAFTRAINQAHGTNAVLQHLRFTAGQSTGWHTHPGPNIVLVVAGSLTLTDDHCNDTSYEGGTGFATGLGIHRAVAGAQGADFYSLYVLPQDADVLRTDSQPPVCDAH
jgi:quercetin dioxygenase-like cupin family protein